MSSRTKCYQDICSDRKKYDTLIYSITCDVCMDKKLKYIASIDAETFEEKLERKLQESIRKHGVQSFEPAPSESNDA